MKPAIAYAIIYRWSSYSGGGEVVAITSPDHHQPVGVDTYGYRENPRPAG